jgi:hypothetical protein
VKPIAVESENGRVAIRDSLVQPAHRGENTVSPQCGFKSLNGLGHEVRVFPTSLFVDRALSGVRPALNTSAGKGSLAYCRGFLFFGACAARSYSETVSAIISVRPSLPGCSIMLITSCLPSHTA